MVFENVAKQALKFFFYVLFFFCNFCILLIYFFSIFFILTFSSIQASCTLEAGVKIYSLRVDSVHSEAYKVLGGINRVGQENEQG